MRLALQLPSIRMSHFSVLVIGDHIEQQLQPYHEFECTGTNDQYVQDVDVTEELRERMTGDEPETLEAALDWHGLADKMVSDESEVDREDDHKFGFAVVKDGQLIKAVNRTNPNKKWDWWVVGGRQGGFLKLKQGAEGYLCKRFGQIFDAEYRTVPSDNGRADQCLKGAADFDGMRDEAAQEAGERWDKAHAALTKAGASTVWRTWEQCHEEDHKDDFEKARQAYHAQPSVPAIKDAFPGEYFLSADEFQVSREQYVQAARDRAVAPYALVKDGQWYAKGEMGWFGMSDDMLSQDDWNTKVNELLDSLPDDTLLTVVDCHI